MPPVAPPATSGRHSYVIAALLVGAAIGVRLALSAWLGDSVVGDVVAVRPVMTTTLSADHRAVDGHRGGFFLSALDRALQEPEQL